ncbi:ABC transporter ATP-binding protein [Brevibacterium sp. LE-L]|uniref:ABC transporter ATP-binding protein n=1 Tax=unclassified Brevibacterium TaxID=2614124 RepID=UPI003CEDD3EE
MRYDQHPVAPSQQNHVPRLSAAGLQVRYGDAVALNGVSFSVHDGESVAIMGPSGSGKTTLLHALAGIIRPDDGTVALRTLDGQGRSQIVRVDELSDPARSELRLQEFGFVFQQGMLIPELTAMENVMMPLLLTGVTKSEANSRAGQLLQELGMTGLEQRRIGQLSGGQAQRVAIARARATQAQVVFADEPTGALDSRTAADVLALLLRSTSEQGRALVLVTHDKDVAAACSRVVRLRDGQIVEQLSDRQADG